MFEEFTKHHRPENPEQPDKDRIEADKAAVFARINTENAAFDNDGKFTKNTADGDRSDNIEILIPQEVFPKKKKQTPKFIAPLVSAAAAAAVAIAVVASVNLFGKQPVVVDINSSPALSGTSSDLSDNSEPSSADSTAPEVSSDSSSSDDGYSEACSSVDDPSGSSYSFFPTGWDRAVFSARYVRTNGYIEGEKYPKTVWITSKEELTDYYEQNKDKYDFGSPDSDRENFSLIVSLYDEEFFKKSNLLFVILEEGSGSIGHTVTNAVYHPDDKSLGITIRRLMPEVGTADMAKWHIVMEVYKETYAETVNVDFNNFSSADIPEFETVVQLSSEEATELLKNFAFGDLRYKWGEPAWTLSEHFGGGWEYDGGKEIVCYFGQAKPDQVWTVKNVEFFPEHV